MKLIVTGGSGFVGKALCKELCRLNHEVIAVAPHLPEKRSEGVVYIRSQLTKGQIPSVFSECDGIIHLAGANIFHRWTPQYKQLLIDSRVSTAHAIYDFVSQLHHKPKVFISASAVGFYGHRGEERLDETSLPGKGFLSSLCVDWEKSREKFSSLGMRTVSVRTAPVLSSQGGFLEKMLPLFRLGLGGKFGDGSQWFPWIHLKDLVNVYIQAVLDPYLEGVINAVAPESVRNIDFTKQLGAMLKKPTFLTVPACVLRLALGEFSTALLDSQQVTPRVLQGIDFSFSYPTLSDAFSDALS